MKLIQLAVTAALVTSFSALQAQTAPSPLQKPQSNSLPPPNKSASGAPVAPKATPQSNVLGRQPSPTHATSVDPPKVDPNTAPASSLGAIHRSNPVIVPPPQPNPTEQSYSRDQGFASQHGTRPDPRVSTTPGSGSSQPVPGRPPIAAQPRPHQGSPFKGSGGDDVLVTGASGGGRTGDAGKDLLSAGQKVTPAAPPKSQTGQQPGKR